MFYCFSAKKPGNCGALASDEWAIYSTASRAVEYYYNSIGENSDIDRSGDNKLHRNHNQHLNPNTYPKPNT